MRSSSNVTRISSSDRIEHAYEKASTMKGMARPTSKSAPPVAGPSSVGAQVANPSTRSAFVRKNLGQTSSEKPTPGISRMMRSRERPIGK
jgi:hypothetical protein